MINTFSRLQSKLTGFQLTAATFCALLFNLWATKILNAAYLASGFPVPYWQAQLSFDDQKIKTWYELLHRNQSVDLYIRAQLIDFVFIASVLVLHITALLALSRAFSAESRARHALIWAALLSAIAPLADGIENGISFTMLANPADFMPLLAIVYSSAAAIKFGMFVFAYVVGAGGLVVAVYCHAIRKRRGVGEV